MLNPRQILGFPPWQDVRFGSKADMCSARHVRFTPKRTCAPQLGMSALCQKRTHAVQQNGSLFDDFIGAGEHQRRNCEAQFLSGFKIDHQLVLGRRLHWKVGRPLAL